MKNDECNFIIETEGAKTSSHEQFFAYILFVYLLRDYFCNFQKYHCIFSPERTFKNVIKFVRGHYLRKLEI